MRPRRFYGFYRERCFHGWRLPVTRWHVLDRMMLHHSPFFDAGQYL